MSLNRTYFQQYSDIVDIIERCDGRGATIQDILDSGVASLDETHKLGRVSVSYRVREMVNAGVLRSVGQRPTYYQVAKPQLLNRPNYQRTPLNALESAVEAVGEGYYGHEGSADELLNELKPLLDRWVYDYAQDLRQQIHERDAKIAELEAKLEQARKLFQ